MQTVAVSQLTCNPSTINHSNSSNIELMFIQNLNNLRHAKQMCGQRDLNSHSQTANSIDLDLNVNSKIAIERMIVLDMAVETEVIQAKFCMFQHVLI